MSYKESSDILREIIKECKNQAKNPNGVKIKQDINKGITKDFIISNLDCYV